MDDLATEALDFDEELAAEEEQEREAFGESDYVADPRALFGSDGGGAGDAGSVDASAGPGFRARG
jgi:hypothetical protein